MHKIFSAFFICYIFCGLTSAFSQDNAEIKNIETTDTQQKSQNVFDNPIYKYTENSVEINLESIEF